jgi:serine/threonine protein phosphatase PrpC
VGYEFFVANLGDCRCFGCKNGKIYPLSTDHRPEREYLNKI